MSSIDLESLLLPLSADAPSGENLEYDPDYAAMETAATGKGEQQFGDTVIPGEEPDWKEVRRLVLGLSERTRDLRIGLMLARTLLKMDGIAGFRDGLALLKGYIDKFWDTVHPQLDPEDDNDPTLRVNTVASLTDGATFLKSVRETTLLKLPGLGPFAYRDWMIATGEMPPAANAAKPEQSSLEGAFAACDPAQLAAVATAASEAFELVKGLEASLTDQVGTSAAPSLEKLRDLLRGMSRFLNDRSAALGSGGNAAPAATGAAADGTLINAAAPLVSPQRIAGEITSREDVIRMLDKILEYYRRHEPSSPLPLLILRAKRLASKNFLEILRDMTPDALSQALSIGGLSDVSELNPSYDE